MSKIIAVISAKISEVMQSNQPVYFGSVLSTISSILTYQNIMFSITTVIGLFISYLAYRSKKRRDDEYIRLRRRDSDAIAQYLARETHLNDVDEAPRVVKKFLDSVEKDAENMPPVRD